MENQAIEKWQIVWQFGNRHSSCRSHKNVCVWGIHRGDVGGRQSIVKKLAWSYLTQGSLFGMAAGRGERWGFLSIVPDGSGTPMQLLLLWNRGLTREMETILSGGLRRSITPCPIRSVKNRTRNGDRPNQPARVFCNVPQRWLSWESRR